MDFSNTVTEPPLRTHSNSASEGSNHTFYGKRAAEWQEKNVPIDGTKVEDGEKRGLDLPICCAECSTSMMSILIWIGPKSHLNSIPRALSSQSTLMPMTLPHADDTPLRCVKFNCIKTGWLAHGYAVKRRIVARLSSTSHRPFNRRS